MKKLFAIVFSMMCVFNLFGCEKTPNNTETEISKNNIIGYITELDKGTVSVDEIEWVTVPGERATELGITDDNAPNGFYIHNKESVTVEYDIADKCVICILDWENNFVVKQIELVNFIDVHRQRDNVLIPYMFAIENGKVISIEEHYIP